MNINEVKNVEVGGEVRFFEKGEEYEEYMGPNSK